MTEWRVRWFGACLLALAMTACSEREAAPRTPPKADLTPAELRVNDVTVRATTMPASQLNAAMAREYGITPAPDQVLLVVGLRRGGGSDEQSLEGNVRAEAVNLLGGRQAVALREVRSGEFIDYVGTAHLQLPDTLRFFVDIQVADHEPMSLRFHRDFFR